MKLRPFLLAALAAVLVHPAALAADRKTHELDSAKLAAVKRVAIVSVYGPVEFSEGLGEKIDLQPFVDSAETTLGAALRQAGYEVVPGEEVKAAINAKFVGSYLDFMAEEYKKNNRRASDAEIQKVRTQLETSGMLKFAPQGRAAVSANTALVAGTDINFGPWTLEFTPQGQPATVLKKPTYAPAMVAALAAVAQAVNADAFLVARAWPGTAKVAVPKAQPKTNGTGLFTAINAMTDAAKQLKALGGGKYGATILEVAMFSRDRSRVFADHVVGRSKTDEGNVTVAFQIKNGIGAGKAVPLMKEALDSSLATTFLHLMGKELPANTPGLGVEAIAQPLSGGAAASSSATSGAGVGGRYVLNAINAKPVPATNENQVTFHSGVLVLNPDGTYANDMVYSGGPKGAVGASKEEKTQSVKGKYTVKGSTVALAPEGGMLVKMTAPRNGEVAGDTITLFPGAYTYTREGTAQPAAAR